MFSLVPLSIFFSLSFFGILTKKEEKDSKQLVVKWIVYLTVVSTVLISVIYDCFNYFFITIYILGFYELLKLVLEIRKKMFLLLFYVLMVYFSFSFFANVTKENLMLILISVFLFDGYSQMFGRLFGKTKLTKISPNKTREGFTLALVVLLFHHLLWAFYKNLELINVFLLSVIFSVVCLIGDLFFSYLKRISNIKDFSILIPGHGGVLDRFDALIFVGFVFWFLGFLKPIIYANVELLVYMLLFVVLFAIAEILYHFFKIQVEYTRKLVHIGSGLLSLSFPFYLTQSLAVLILCSLFLGILFLSKKFKLLPSINRVERDSLGSVLFPVSVYLCFLVYLYFQNNIFYLLPILILTFSDSLAAILGKKYPRGKYQVFQSQKTLVGSFAFFITTFITGCFFYDLTHKNFVFLLVFSIILSATEAISSKGIDNFSIPLITVLGILEY